MEYLYDKLAAYGESDYYGFHMPGHKRNSRITGAELPYKIDITEIEGFDDLHHAKGIIKELEAEAASLYHAEETHLLINGSTVGILSAIEGCTHRGDKILMARNCHKSVYHAVCMKELEPVYIYPDMCEETGLNEAISPEETDKILSREKDIKAIMITSPTYDGVISDIGRIAEIAHSYGIPLIVDEAHGAHFGFHPYFPENANKKGADIVIHSLHKTMPALTQTALIHINGSVVNRESVRRYLHMLQSSSPSYILMAGAAACFRTIRERGRDLFDRYVELLKEAQNSLNKLKFLRYISSVDDKSKILISVKQTDITSKELYDILLKRYHLQMEMTAGDYVLAMTSIGDTKEGMDRLVNALTEIDREVEKRMRKDNREYGEIHIAGRLPRQKKVYSPAEMINLSEQVSASGQYEEKGHIEKREYQDCMGMISTEYAYLYPPGIPLIVPGEEISSEAVKLMELYERMGFSIEGTSVENKIGVWING